MLCLFTAAFFLSLSLCLRCLFIGCGDLTLVELAECHGWLKRRGVVVLVVVMGGLFGGGV